VVEGGGGVKVGVVGGGDTDVESRIWSQALSEEGHLAVLRTTVVTLRFFGDDLDPAEVTARLGVEPTSTTIKGDIRPLTSGSRVASKTSSWLLKAADRSPGDLDGQIEELLARLTPDLAVWRDLSARFAGSLFCGLFMETSNDGDELGPETLAMLGSRGLSLQLDIYEAME